MSDNFNIIYYRKTDNFLITIELDADTLYPGNKLTGNLILTPKKENLEISYTKSSESTKEVSVLFTLTQFQKLQIESADKNKDKTEKICKREIFYLLSNEEIKNLAEIKIMGVSRFPPIKIPFSILLPGLEKDNFYPSFEYHDNKKNTHIFIRHLLTVETEFFEAKNSIGVIICKPPSPDAVFLKNNNNNIEKKENVKYMGWFGGENEKLYYFMKLDKNSYEFNKDIQIKMKLGIEKSGLNKAELIKISIKFTRNLFVKSFIPIMKDFEASEELSTERTFPKKTICNFKPKQMLDEIVISPDASYKENFLEDEDQIKEYITLDKDFLTEDYDKKNKVLMPNIITDLFTCKYVIEVVFSFKKIKTEIKEEINIDMFYDTKKKDTNLFDYLFDVNNKDYDNDEKFEEGFTKGIQRDRSRTVSTANLFESGVDVNDIKKGQAILRGGQDK